MKILAFSDVHEDETALESLSRVAPEFDYVFICGDISQSGIFAESMLNAVPNGFVIPGNWDNKRVNDLLSNSKQWLHERRCELPDGLNAVGFGFSNPTPFGTYGELSEKDIYSRMSKLRIDESSLLLLHCPPKGHFDKIKGQNIGSESILRIILEKKPLAAFCGHVHEYFGTFILGDTMLIKLPPANEMRACSINVSNKKIITEFISL